MNLLRKVFAIQAILLLLVLHSANAQIQMGEAFQWSTIGELKSLGTTIAKLEYRVTDTDSVFFLLMKDFTKRQEPNYFSIQFRSHGNTLAVFKALLLSFFDDNHRKGDNYMKTFRLGNTPVNLQHCMLIVNRGVRLTASEGYINLSEKQVKKLFGK